MCSLYLIQKTNKKHSFFSFTLGVGPKIILYGKDKSLKILLAVYRKLHYLAYKVIRLSFSLQKRNFNIFCRQNNIKKLVRTTSLNEESCINHHRKDKRDQNQSALRPESERKSRQKYLFSPLSQNSLFSSLISSLNNSRSMKSSYAS